MARFDCRTSPCAKRRSMLPEKYSIDYDELLAAALSENPADIVAFLQSQYTIPDVTPNYVH